MLQWPVTRHFIEAYICVCVCVFMCVCAKLYTHTPHAQVSFFKQLIRRGLHSTMQVQVEHQIKGNMLWLSKRTCLFMSQSIICVCEKIHDDGIIPSKICSSGGRKPLARSALHYTHTYTLTRSLTDPPTRSSSTCTQGLYNFLKFHIIEQFEVCGVACGDARCE